MWCMKNIIKIKIFRMVSMMQIVIMLYLLNELCYLSNHFLTTYETAKDILSCNVDIDTETNTSKKLLKK